jgi:hypothetical protein
MSQTNADADNLAIRIKLEALISERDGMTAGNEMRKHGGWALAYDDTCFMQNAEDMRKLLADVRAEP